MSSGRGHGLVSALELAFLGTVLYNRNNWQGRLAGGQAAHRIGLGAAVDFGREVPLTRHVARDWSIFRRENAFDEKGVVRKMDLSPSASKGDSPL